MIKTIHAVFVGGPWGKQVMRWSGSSGPIYVDDGVYEPTKTKTLVGFGNDWKIATVYRWKSNNEVR